MNYFEAHYSNESSFESPQKAVCGIGPSMDPTATTIVDAPSFTLYCDNPPIIRHLAIYPDTSSRHTSFDLCEYKVYAQIQGK